MPRAITTQHLTDSMLIPLFTTARRRKGPDPTTHRSSEDELDLGVACHEAVAVTLGGPAGVKPNAKPGMVPSDGEIERDSVIDMRTRRRSHCLLQMHVKDGRIGEASVLSGVFVL